jgi:heparin binding hemagglutinin HbhA
MTKTRNSNDIPAPIYAAAGAGELAYEKLRQLPELAARTARSASELRQRLATENRDFKAEWTRVRDSAQRGTAVVVAKAATAQERAVAGYRNLVARGERVVNGRLGVTTGHAERTEIEVEVGPVQSGARAGASAPSAPAE